MNLEQLMILDHYLYYLVAGVVQILELVLLIVSVLKDILLLVDFHVVQELEQQLAHPQVLANHLSFLHGQNYISVHLLSSL